MQPEDFAEPIPVALHKSVEREQSIAMGSLNDTTKEKSQHRESSEFIRLSEVTPKKVEWLWQVRIPLGEITIIDGDPGVNKSVLIADLAARVSTGAPMPDGSDGGLGGVLLLGAEDSVSKTLTNRLRAAGADLEKIWTIDRPVTLPDDVNLIEEYMFKANARLLAIDPIMAYLKSDANNDQSVRKALTPLKRLAERANAAIILVRHLNKSGARHSLYRGSGSIGIIAAARSGLLIAKDPADDHLRVLAHVKSNLGPLAPTLLFEPRAAGSDVNIRWLGPCDYKPDDLLRSSSNRDGKFEMAKTWLIDTLRAGPVAQRDLEEHIASLGISMRTLIRAKSALGIVSERKGFGTGSSVYWTITATLDDDV